MNFALTILDFVPLADSIYQKLPSSTILSCLKKDKDGKEIEKLNLNISNKVLAWHKLNRAKEEVTLIHVS
jgi:hypothetical protein